MVEMLFHLRKATKRIISCVVLFIFALLLTTSRAPTTLEEVLNEGELRVVTLKGSTTYFENAKGKGGFDYRRNINHGRPRHIGKHRCGDEKRD